MFKFKYCDYFCRTKNSYRGSLYLGTFTIYYCGQLLEYGVKVHKYNGYIQTKTMIIDNELCGIFYDNNFVENYTQIYQQDILNCHEYTYQQFQERILKEKVSASFFLLFAPLM